MPMRVRVSHLAVLLLAVVLTATGCAARANPALGDVRLALRVKTALINDARLGTQPIDVRAAGSVVTLEGQVRSDADRERAVAVARSVAGVTDVVATLSVDETLPSEAPAGPFAAPPSVRREGPLRLIGLGASVRATPVTADGLGQALGAGLLLRLPVRNGLGPAIGFSWMDVEIEASPHGTPGLAHLRMRPVMLGLAYGREAGRTSLSASVVGGWAFNSVRADPGQAGPFRAIHATNGFVWRPGVAVWHDLGPRLGVNAFVGGLFARPRVTFAADDTVETTRMPTGTLIVSVGVAYWLF